MKQSPGKWKYLYGSESANSQVRYRKTNNVVEVSVDSEKGTDSDWKVGTLPVGFRPSVDVFVSAVASSGYSLSDHTGYLQVKSNGVVYCGRKYADGSGRILGYVSYLV